VLWCIKAWTRPTGEFAPNERNEPTFCIPAVDDVADLDGMERQDRCRRSRWTRMMNGQIRNEPALRQLEIIKLLAFELVHLASVGARYRDVTACLVFSSFLH
jgi:hypothetical protein